MCAAGVCQPLCRLLPECTAAVFRQRAGANGELCGAAVCNRCERGTDRYERRHMFSAYICPNRRTAEHRHARPDLEYLEKAGGRRAAGILSSHFLSVSHCPPQRQLNFCCSPVKFQRPIESECEPSTDIKIHEFSDRRYKK